MGEHMFISAPDGYVTFSILWFCNLEHTLTDAYHHFGIVAKDEPSSGKPNGIWMVLLIASCFLSG